MLEPQGDIIFQIVPIFIGIVFVIVISFVLLTIFKSVSTWSHNNNQPRVRSVAKVVTKRTSVYGGRKTQARNNYHVTFEFESGDRMEMTVSGQEYGQLVEGDLGELEFQGTRYLGFTRQKFKPSATNTI